MIKMNVVYLSIVEFNYFQSSLLNLSNKWHLDDEHVYTAQGFVGIDGWINRWMGSMLGCNVHF